MFAGAQEHKVRWGLALDELEPTGVELRPRVPLPGHTELTGPSLVTAAPAKPLSEIIGPLNSTASPSPTTATGSRPSTTSATSRTGWHRACASFAERLPRASYPAADVQVGRARRRRSQQPRRSYEPDSSPRG
jgi:hypothetical protein